jgi:hypothetical protein
MVPGQSGPRTGALKAMQNQLFHDLALCLARPPRHSEPLRDRYTTLRQSTPNDSRDTKSHKYVVEYRTAIEPLGP